VSRFARSVGSNLGAGAVRVFSPLVHPLETAHGIAQTGLAALGDTAAQQAVGEGIIRPFVENPSGEAVAAIPQAALALAGAGGKGGLAGETSDVLKTPVAERDIPVVSKFARQRAAAPGENFTPQQASSHAAVIAEGSAAGDTGYIPRDIAQATGSKLRQIAAQSPDEITAIRTGTPEDAYAAHQSILQKAKAEIDQRHAAALGTAQDAPVDMRPVQQSIQPTKYQLEGMDQADADAINALQQRAGQVKTLRGLNEFRQQLATEDTTLRNPMAQGKSALYPQAVRNMYSAVRDAYYDQLEKATGQNFQADKRLEGNIIQEMRGALNSGTRLSVGEARENAALPRQTAADIIEGAGSGNRISIPIIGGVASRFAKSIRGTKLGQIQQHLQRFYGDLPEPEGQTTGAPAMPAPRQLESNVPANVEVGPAGAPGAPTVTPPTTPPPPSTITPTPDAMPLLSAQAGPEGAGVPTTIEPTNAPPPVNPATAATRTRPPLPPNPQAPAAGANVVTPQGTVIPQRLQLPAPIRSPRTGQSLKIGDEVTVSGRQGTVAGVNAKTGKVQIKWR
jgi:hypothetical protein